MQRMRNNDECMLGGVMEEKRGMVRAVPLAGGRSPGRVRSSVRVLESRMLSMAALLGSRRTLVCILAGAYRRSSHGWRRDREWDGARCPPRWRPLAGPCALERARVLESRALSMAALLGAADDCAPVGGSQSGGGL